MMKDSFNLTPHLQTVATTLMKTYFFSLHRPRHKNAMEKVRCKQNPLSSKHSAKLLLIFADKSSTLGGRPSSSALPARTHVRRILLQWPIQLLWTGSVRHTSLNKKV